MSGQPGQLETANNLFWRSYAVSLLVVLLAFADLIVWRAIQVFPEALCA